MPYIDALSRIGEIRANIATLDTATTPTSTTTTAATSAASADLFADAVSQVTPVAESGTAASSTGEAIVAQAKTYLGVPYVFGGTTKSGIDCSGLVQSVLKDLGIDVPRVVQDQVNIGTEVPSLAQAQPGDLLITKDKGHIVIYVGDGKVLHAPRPGKNVEIVNNWLKDSDLATIRRVTSPTAAATSSAQLTSLSAAAQAQAFGMSA